MNYLREYMNTNPLIRREKNFDKWEKETKKNLDNFVLVIITILTLTSVAMLPIVTYLLA